MDAALLTFGESKEEERGGYSLSKGNNPIDEVQPNSLLIIGAAL